MLSYSFMLLAFFTAPALGSAVGGYRSLPKGAAERALGVDHGRRGDTWWWGGRAGLSRARSGFRRRSGCSVINGSGGATTREGVGSRVSRSNAVHKREPRGGSLAVAEGLARGGANGGYNYDDDYYGGPGGGEDPYYEDAGGWGDDGGGADRGRDGGRYDPYDDGRAPTKGRSGLNVAGFDLTGTITKGNKKYGIYALVGSILLTMMGVSLMFEKNLIRLGNLGFIAGMALFIGPSNVVRYFTQSSKLRGSIIFAVGFFFVFTGHPIIGLVIEAFGFLNLFGNMLPMVWAMASNMPFVKDIIGSSSKQNKSSGRSKQRRSSRPPSSRDYDQGYGYEDDEWDNGGGGGWGYDDYDQGRR